MDDLVSSVLRQKVQFQDEKKKLYTFKVWCYGVCSIIQSSVYIFEKVGTKISSDEIYQLLASCTLPFSTLPSNALVSFVGEGRIPVQ